MGFFRKPRSGENLTFLLSGVGLGAALMYVFDPEKGRRRRALARDKAIHAAHRTGDALGSRSRDIANRARGVFAEARSSFEHASRGEGQTEAPGNAQPDERRAGSRPASRETENA